MEDADGRGERQPVLQRPGVTEASTAVLIGALLSTGTWRTYGVMTGLAQFGVAAVFGAVLGLTARVSRRLMWVVGVALTAACLAVLVAIVT